MGRARGRGKIKNSKKYNIPSTFGYFGVAKFMFDVSLIKIVAPGAGTKVENDLKYNTGIK